MRSSCAHSEDPGVRSAAGRRAASALVAVGGAAVLGLAAWLEPAASGHSTHTQLGLARCTFLALTGWPCPMCGATTTFALMAEGRVLEGLVNQPFAAALFLLTCAVVGVATAEAAWPRGRWIRLRAHLDEREGWLAAIVLVAMCAGWTWKIALMTWTAPSP